MSANLEFVQRGENEFREYTVGLPRRFDCSGEGYLEYTVHNGTTHVFAGQCQISTIKQWGRKIDAAKAISLIPNFEAVRAEAIKEAEAMQSAWMEKRKEMGILFKEMMLQSMSKEELEAELLKRK